MKYLVKQCAEDLRPKNGPGKATWSRCGPRISLITLAQDHWGSRFWDFGIVEPLAQRDRASCPDSARRIHKHQTLPARALSLLMTQPPFKR